jgi:hypothetical protein
MTSKDYDVVANCVAASCVELELYDNQCVALINCFTGMLSLDNYRFSPETFRTVTAVKIKQYKEKQKQERVS